MFFSLPKAKKRIPTHKENPRTRKCFHVPCESKGTDLKIGTPHKRFLKIIQNLRIAELHLVRSLSGLGFFFASKWLDRFVFLTLHKLISQP